MARRQSKLRGRKKTPTCPACGASEVVPIIHGMVTSMLQQSIDAGEAVRADREEWEGMAQWYCKQCGCDWSGQWRRFKKPENLR